MRIDSRQAHTWRNRIVFGFLFALAGTWAAVAPQANLGLGERLRLAFTTITIFAAIIAAAAGFRNPRIELQGVDLSTASFARNLIKSSGDLMPALPLLIFAAALQAVSLIELFVAIGSILFLAATSLASRWSLLATIAGLLLYASHHRSWVEISILLLFTVHIGFKATLSMNIANDTRLLQPSLIAMAATPLQADEICGHAQRLYRARFFVLLAALVLCNIAFLAILPSLKIPLEAKFQLATALVGGIFFLWLDARALFWSGMLGSLRGQSFVPTFTMIVGVPWAVAWAFSAFHFGEALSPNEAAAYFVLWSALGTVLSWTIASHAKATLHRDIRELLS